MKSARFWLGLSFAPLVPAMAASLLMSRNPEIQAWLLNGHMLFLWLPVIVIFVFSLFAMIKWWGMADEAVQEAHKWSWFWGALGGLVIIVVPLMLSFHLENGQVYRRYIALAPGNELFLGMFTVLLPMVAGYGVAWVIWWLRRR